MCGHNDENMCNVGSKKIPTQEWQGGLPTMLRDITLLPLPLSQQATPTHLCSAVAFDELWADHSRDNQTKDGLRAVY